MKPHTHFERKSLRDITPGELIILPLYGANNIAHCLVLKNEPLVVSLAVLKDRDGKFKAPHWVEIDKRDQPVISLGTDWYMMPSAPVLNVSEASVLQERSGACSLTVKGLVLHLTHPRDEGEIAFSLNDNEFVDPMQSSGVVFKDWEIYTLGQGADFSHRDEFAKHSIGDLA